MNRIADDLAGCIEPLFLRVLGQFNPRGGIAICPLALRVSPDLDDEGVLRVRRLFEQYDAVRRP